MYEVTMRGTYGEHIMGAFDEFDNALECYEKLIADDLPNRARLYDIQPVSGSLTGEEVKRMSEVT